MSPSQIVQKLLPACKHAQTSWNSACLGMLGADKSSCLRAARRQAAICLEWYGIR
jgi:hypothetical protein